MPPGVHPPLSGAPLAPPCLLPESSAKENHEQSWLGEGLIPASHPHTPSQPPWLATLFIIIKEESGRLARR